MCRAVWIGLSMLWWGQVQAAGVALVLSGGGARGISEVGVLQVLEEHRIPVSCVVGTSMGAIVGAAYAAGMDPESMPAVLTGVDWYNMFANRSPRRFLPYGVKQDDWQTDFDFTLHLQGWSVLPPVHLINVQNIDMFFRQLVGYSPIMSFDDLPLPFRAIATDLNHGGMVVMDHGDLPLVMRASMTVPGAFPPVDYQGRLVVDGGLADNLPIDVGRHLCGQAVIAVDVTTPSVEDKQPGSILEVAQQVINQALQQNVRQQKASLQPIDTLIVPDLKGIGSFDFDQTALLIQRGRQAAEAALGQLRRYQVSEQDYRIWKEQWQSRIVQVPRVANVILSPLKRANTRIVMSQLDVHTGTALNMLALQESIARIYARGDFEHLSAHSPC
ncbi:MAG: patatin-like phospholipase family protein [Pseudomonadales bacterium]|nr:patatin-like phospholipase family protein [Pseudomonadales bacterium]